MLLLANEFLFSLFESVGNNIQSVPTKEAIRNPLDASFTYHSGEGVKLFSTEYDTQTCIL